MITEDDLKLYYKCFYKVVEDYPEINLKYDYNDIIITTLYEDVIIISSDNLSFSHNIQYVQNFIEGKINIFLLNKSLKNIDDLKEEFNIVYFIDNYVYDLVINNDIRTISTLLEIKAKTFQLYESKLSLDNLNEELQDIVNNKQEATRRKMWKWI